jgi:hypothetical protein
LKPETKVREPHERHGDKYMLFIIEKYQEIHGVETFDLDDVAEWAEKELKYIVAPITPKQMLKRKLTRALKTERIVDPQKREVRKWLSVRHNENGHVWTEWAQMLNADPGHMRMSQQQHRQYILDNCRQHKLVFDSYNDNNKFGATLPPNDYNFNPDLDELDLPTKYPLDKPEE